MALHGWERRGFLLFAAFLAAGMALAVWAASPLWSNAPQAPQETTPTSGAVIAAAVTAFILLSVGATTLILWALRTGREGIIQAIVLAAVAIVLVVPLMRGVLWLQGGLGDWAWLLGFLLSGALVVAWWRTRAWWLTDLVTLALGASLAAVLGATLGVLPLIPLLAAMAVFDAIAVLRTGTMVRLAHASRRMRLPTLIASGPGVRRRAPRPSPVTAAPGEAPDPAPRPTPRPGGILLFGVGDIVFPGSLLVAATDPSAAWGAGPAVGAAVGTMVAYAVLVRMTSGRHALPGLPVLNGGALAGFLVGLLIDTGSLRFWT